MKKATQLFASAIIIGILSLSSLQSNAHCEVPCGIYGDSVRITLLYEHITTVEKSMNMINELSKQDSPDYNQLVRWVTNKEEHAKKIQEIVSQYFLHQRVKPTTSDNEEAYKKYLKQLELLHNISVFAMKSKQSTDLGHIETLREKVHNFEHVYFGGHTH
ncbi:MAG: superoxide dismutase [Prolixibacteraceae bacterium]|jgi:nickel superoxide dismutase|nr:superoxide dismutase [Prolixibacteraceae bacterium]MBT6004958.1 superoxide dismutase [Prolixibacteraceae bacterium]MBT6765936.1 superoxide dismutase [Prolixibacteraceae bacterium]MBT6998644.1 superoxide dismutase [Prolixibacteraceae bacterium]MBT7397445.1 superoxide dismutase [Prolixibacteraceae bacterium]